MSNGKFAKRKGVATKMMFMILAVVLIVGISIGGTLAWLTATSGPVTNTFTTSDIEITLAESDDLDLKMVPGYTITKDPKATVEAGSEDCYLFVKLEKSTNFDDFMTYTIASGWTELTSAAGTNYKVYYRVFDSKDSTNTNAQGTAYSILEDDQVTVKSTVTKADMKALSAATYPTLTVTAYASQLYKSNSTAAGAVNKFTPAEAWDIVPKA
ncbi:MAG: hypothetical protein MSS60_12345 [Clostridiales bacterium]|nr:hypothetical protein [Clostridiales bacterium]